MGPHKKSKVEQTFGYKNGYVNLTCIAQAEPMANFTWYKGNKMLNGKNHKIFNGEHVSLLQVRHQQEVPYTQNSLNIFLVLGLCE